MCLHAYHEIFIMVKYAKYVVIESTVVEKEENADFIYLLVFWDRVL